MKSIHEVWSQTDMTWHVGPYVIMPDHIHFLCRPAGMNMDHQPGIERWTAFWKCCLTKKIQEKSPDWNEHWQRGLFHHRMRSDVHLAETLEYMRNNPARAGLSETAESWPWQGSIYDWL